MAHHDGVAEEEAPPIPSDPIAPSGANGPSGTGRYDTDAPPLAFGQPLDAATLAAIAADAAANAPLAWSRQWQPFGVPTMQPPFVGKGQGKGAGWSGEQPWAPFQWDSAVPSPFQYSAWPEESGGLTCGQPGSAWSDWSHPQGSQWHADSSFGNTPDYDLAPELSQMDAYAAVEAHASAASPAVEIDRIDPQKMALGLLQQMKREETGTTVPTVGAPQASAAVKPSPGVASPTHSGDCDDLRDDMASAVQKFLAGDALEDSESASETDFVADTLDRDFALQCTDVHAGAASEGTSEPGPAETISAEPAAGNESEPVEMMSQFMLILRRRTLPTEFTEERRRQIHSVISSCVVSLYRDRIKPIQSHVQSRMRERGQSEELVRLLLPLCARDCRYSLLPPVHGEQPIVLLADEPPWFEGWVDVEDPADEYGQDVWDEFISFLHGDGGVELPQKPYLAAVELRQRNVRQLQGLSLGELEHVVRLSLGERRLLVVHQRQLRPTRIVQQLQAQDKEQKSKPPEAGKGKQNPGGSQDAGWLSDITNRDDLTVVLLHLMQRFPDGLSLSRIKPHLRMICRRNLNEAAFDCSQLAEVFKLHPLCHIFPLEQTPGRNETVVKTPNHSAIPGHIWQKFYHYGPVSAAWGPVPGYDPGTDGT